jgi:hypothetical protein
MKRHIKCVLLTDFTLYEYVQLSARRLVGSSYSAGTRCAHTHAHTYTCMHTCPCTAHPIPPLRGVLSQELNGVGWPVPFPLRTAHNQATMKCITWLKICNTNLTYLHHPQADNNNESACILVVGGRLYPTYVILTD